MAKHLGLFSDVDYNAVCWRLYAKGIDKDVEIKYVSDAIFLYKSKA